MDDTKILFDKLGTLVRDRNIVSGTHAMSDAEVCDLVARLVVRAKELQAENTALRASTKSKSDERDVWYLSEQPTDPFVYVPKDNRQE